MRIAAAQFAPGTDKTANLQTITTLLGQASGSGAELVVLPEYSIYSDRDPKARFASAAEPLDGPFVSRLGELAKTYAVHLVAGTLERLPGTDRAANTLVAFDETGTLTGSYRKQHLYDAFGFTESDQVHPGELDVAPLVLQVGGLQVGAVTCYDLRFPESFRVVVDAGAQVVVLPAQWVTGPVKEDHWRTLLRARAIENTVYAVGAGQTGPIGCGQSMIVDPLGTVLACAGEAPGVVLADLSAQRLEQVRTRVPVLANRRYSVVARPS